MISYWEIIADEMKAEGWSIGWNKVATKAGVLWAADATKHDGRRFISRAEELVVAMLELQKMTKADRT